ncbi:protein of unknown function [Serratia sp. Tan611]|nr:protein of unknown function [Serratia sp. Tan611]
MLFLDKRRERMSELVRWQTLETLPYGTTGPDYR